MLRLWRRNVWTVKKVSGDTRIWTMDLSDCSRLLYHWAISPRGDKVFRRERQVAMMSWFQSHLAAKKSYGAVRLKVLQYSDLPVSVGGIMVSIAAFQAVDPGSIPGRRMFCQNHNFHVRSLRKKNFVHAVTRIRTWVTAATTQGPNH